jgi:hypothetical protein
VLSFNGYEVELLQNFDAVKAAVLELEVLSHNMDTGDVLCMNRLFQLSSWSCESHLVSHVNLTGLRCSRSNFVEKFTCEQAI